MALVIALPVYLLPSHPPRGPARVYCLKDHEPELGPYWYLGMHELVCRRCGKKWMVTPWGRLEEMEEDDGEAII